MLATFGIQPGLDLFFLPYSELWKTRRQCVEVKLDDASGRTLLRARDGAGCESRRVRWFADIPVVAIYRLLEDVQEENMHSPNGIHEKSIYATLGEFYCHSPRFSELHTARISLGWRQGQIEYTTDEKREIIHLLFQFNCQTHDLVSVKWFPNIPPEDLRAFAL